MCYHYAQGKRKVPAQSSFSSLFWNGFWGWSRATSTLLAILWKISHLCFCLIAIKNRADRDLLKKISSLTLPWSREKIGLIAILWKFSALWLALIAIIIRAARDHSTPNSSKLLFSAPELPASSRMTCLSFLRLVFTISTVYTSSPRLN